MSLLPYVLLYEGICYAENDTRQAGRRVETKCQSAMSYCLKTFHELCQWKCNELMSNDWAVMFIMGSYIRKIEHTVAVTSSMKNSRTYGETAIRASFKWLLWWRTTLLSLSFICNLKNRLNAYQWLAQIFLFKVLNGNTKSRPSTNILSLRFWMGKPSQELAQIFFPWGCEC